MTASAGKPPTTDEMKQAWNEVAEGFSALGRTVKERYQGARGDDAGEAAPAAGTRDAGAALREAFERLVAAGRDLGDRAADVARDDDVKARVRRSAASLNDALAATVELIGDELGGLFKRSKGGGGDTPGDVTATQPPAGGASQEVPASQPPADDAPDDVPASQPPADDARQ